MCAGKALRWGRRPAQAAKLWLKVGAALSRGPFVKEPSSLTLVSTHQPRAHVDAVDAHVEHLPAPVPLNITQILRPQRETPAPTPMDYPQEFSRVLTFLLETFVLID